MTGVQLVIVRDHNGNTLATTDIDPIIAMDVVDIDARVSDSQGVVVVTLTLREGVR